MRKMLLGFVLVLVVCAAAYLRWHHPKHRGEVAYAANRDVILWSTSAVVREAVATVHYGDRLNVLQTFEDQVEVRTQSGVTGWTTEGNLLTAEFWQKAQELDTQTASLPVEAWGHTGVLSNLHMVPGRSAPRIRQLGRDVPLELYERQALDVPQGPHAEQAEGSAQPPEAKKEDWWLVRAKVPEGTVSGWLLGRFVALDVPDPLPNYASAAGLHIQGWFVLNHVDDGMGGTKPQYLVVGTRGAEGQSCDFTMMRVYTWGKKNQRYETAFVDSEVCGKLPVVVAQPKATGGDATFSFQDWGDGAPIERVYRMEQTVVRRERLPGEQTATGRHARG
jgi:hypothetical protein